MTKIDWEAERRTAVHLLRSGMSPSEVAEEMGHAVSWVCKCHDRYAAEGWGGLQDHSHAPHQPGNAYDSAVRQAVRRTRSELEAQAATGGELQYIGAHAIRGELLQQQKQGQYVYAIPSTATIDRILHAAHMTQPHKARAPDTHYPRLQPTTPQQLIQVDIVPHYLRGGSAVACFNALDVVSRYPTGQALARRRALDAGRFLVHTWQTLGIPHYTQVDNEGCFSGGHTHPGVLGKVLRLALYVGTELVFSPFYHPASNGYIERFHQDYNTHVWQARELDDLTAVQQQAERFFADYRHSQHHSALEGQAPAQRHAQVPSTYLEADFVYTGEKLPLVPGRVHFIRQVSAQGTIKVLNLEWELPNSEPEQGVWATLEFTRKGATLTIYDAAPDVTKRRCLGRYPFPLQEPVLAHETVTAQLAPPQSSTSEIPAELRPEAQTPPVTPAQPQALTVARPALPAASVTAVLPLSFTVLLLLVSSVVKWIPRPIPRSPDG